MDNTWQNNFGLLPGESLYDPVTAAGRNHVRPIFQFLDAGTGSHRYCDGCTYGGFNGIVWSQAMSGLGPHDDHAKDGLW